MKHWVLDARGQPLPEVREGRRPHRYAMPVARSRKGTIQGELGLDLRGVSDNTLVQSVRPQVDAWRRLPPSKWGVTPETERLLRWWRDPENRQLPLFFCQLEAIETLIWLVEVAPKAFRERLALANDVANPGLLRIASKMATGTGKTTVMAMLIAWQAVNAARRPNSSKFTNGFLVITPGITIRDRLRVLKPEEPGSYYDDEQRRLVPPEMITDLRSARVCVVNFHTFQLREQVQLSSVARELLGTRQLKTEGDQLVVDNEERRFTETPGQMLQRIAPALASMKKVIVINDEAHHCYRYKPRNDDADAAELRGQDAIEARDNNEAARVWISGIEALANRGQLSTVFDLSATPFFLAGSGHTEGTLFPWVVSDFSLMDAIECGIVKTPRLPVLDDAPAGDVPKYRAIYEHLPSNALPKKGRKTGKEIDPADIPELLRSAIEALYSHYEKTSVEWEREAVGVPPVFIIVANNTSTSKLIYDFISGYEDRETGRLVPGAARLFSNVDSQRLTWFPSPRTILVDSSALEGGDVLPDDFRRAAAFEIEEFRREVERRDGEQAASAITDAQILREVMNTVGKPGKLGSNIRCVVSVSMLTEGWDANTVTHVLGVRAFGTQLLCEQVVGRALRRLNYTPGPDGLLPPEYADVLGVPFEFTKDASPAAVRPPPKMYPVRARDDRSDCEIVFPNVSGYRMVYPSGPLVARFTEESRLTVTSDDVPTQTLVEPIVGDGIKLTLENYRQQRMKAVYFAVAGFALRRYFREDARSPEPSTEELSDLKSVGEIPVYRFGELLRITERWFAECLETHGNEELKRLFLWRPFAQKAAERIARACAPADRGSEYVRAILNPFQPTSSTAEVKFDTSKPVFPTNPQKCQVDHVVVDSGWEKHFAIVLENECADIVDAYVKNHNLGFEVPYEFRGELHHYRPDFILKLHSAEPEYLIVEVKGWKDDQDRAKADTVRRRWIPAVNALGQFGRWDFVELTNVAALATELKHHVAARSGTGVG